MVESVNVEWNLAHNRVDGFASIGFFDRVNCADNRVERGANRVDLSTTESVFSIESVYHNRVDSCHNRVDSCHNRVDSEHNRVDSGAAHSTIFGSTILKQTACHMEQF